MHPILFLTPSSLPSPPSLRSHPTNHALVPICATSTKHTTSSSPTRTRRNAYYRAIPWALLRSHAHFNALCTPVNVSLTSAHSLTALRQDRLPYLHAYTTLPVHAHAMCPLLSLSETALSALLPRKFKGRQATLDAWTALMRQPTPRKRRFDENWRHLHAPNAVLLYLHAEQCMWNSACAKDESVLSACDPLQLREVGLFLATHALYQRLYLPIAASPVALVMRRSPRDFWMWSGYQSILLTYTHIVHRTTAARCSVVHADPASDLDVTQWVEAQIAMFAAGDRIKHADVVRYAVDRGIAVLRVERDERFLEAALNAVFVFLRCVKEGYPPPKGWALLDGIKGIEQLVRDGLRKVQFRMGLNGEQEKKVLSHYRSRMNEWETNRAANPFF